MKRERFFRILAIVCAIIGILQLPWAPARTGGIFFSVLALCCAGEWIFLKNRKRNRFYAGIALLGQFLFALFLVSMVFIQGIIFQGMRTDEPAEHADAILVLGARVYASGPSATLSARLDTAAAYLKSHPQTIAVLCGGQGSNEPMPEAKAMQARLLEEGIASDRLILEDTSNNTIQNISNAHALLDAHFPRSYTTAVVTSDFHLARARRLMLHAGLDPYGVPANTPYFFQRFALHLREYGSIAGLMLTGRW